MHYIYFGKIFYDEFLSIFYLFIRFSENSTYTIISRVFNFLRALANKSKQ